MVAVSSTANPEAAVVEFGGVRRAVEANPRGEFHRVAVAPSALITASVPFLDADAGTRVVVQVEDGGALRGSAAAGAVTLGADHCAHVEFQVSRYDGLHRVTFRRGADVRVLQFWAGPEQPVLVRRES
jgi:hypothetical protein